MFSQFAVPFKNNNGLVTNKVKKMAVAKVELEVPVMPVETNFEVNGVLLTRMPI